MKPLTCIYLLLRIAFVLFLFWALIWVGRNPEKVGRWYGEWQKGQLEEFNER
jgi:hypothetical protein